jgi:hypothetical protein
MEKLGKQAYQGRHTSDMSHSGFRFENLMRAHFSKGFQYPYVVQQPNQHPPKELRT